jgi:hypothetical protein
VSELGYISEMVVTVFADGLTLRGGGEEVNPDTGCWTEPMALSFREVGKVQGFLWTH